jgi:hypothetical protein
VNGRRIMASAKVEQRGGLIGKSHLVFTYGSVAKGNRWGGPHKHAREIARHQGDR